MSDKRQNNQLQMALAFTGEGRSEAPRARREGTESLTAERRTESPAMEEQLMEEVCERKNCLRALQRVKANKGSAGIDGMTVEELPGYLTQHWPAIREQLLSGTYRPQAARRVEIPKPDGGVRKLGIPTVLDRFIQQAVMQVLQGQWDATFSEHSYGFRPQRSAHRRQADAEVNPRVSGSGSDGGRAGQSGRRRDTARWAFHAPYTKGNFDRLQAPMLRFGEDPKESECCDEW